MSAEPYLGEDEADIHYIDHTGDVGFEITAETLESLFVLALRGLLGIVFGRPPTRADARHDIHLEAATLESLLVAWLDELAFLIQSRGVVPTGATVAIDALPAGWELRATLATTPFKPNRDGWQGEIKATTYHGLKVAHEPEGWHARIVIDV